MGAGLVLFYPDGDFCTGNLPQWLILAAPPSSDRSDWSDWSDKRAAPTKKVHHIGYTEWVGKVYPVGFFFWGGDAVLPG